jgi:hypothetical protein
LLEHTRVHAVGTARAEGWRAAGVPPSDPDTVGARTRLKTLDAVAQGIGQAALPATPMTIRLQHGPIRARLAPRHRPRPTGRLDAPLQLRVGSDHEDAGPDRRSTAGHSPG